MGSLLTDYAFIGLGLALILGGIFGRNFYYGDISTPSSRPAPAVFARPFFVVIGSIFLVTGFGALFGIWTLHH